MSAHLNVAGLWLACEEEAECDLPFHVELSVAEARAMPLQALLPLLEIVDPPAKVFPSGAKQWFDDEGMYHRDYGLPAQVHPNGRMEWWIHGMRHRRHDQPAVVTARGGRQWWLNSEMHRLTGGPTEIEEDGTQRWQHGRYGDQHRVDGPAVIHPDGREEFWVDGERVEAP